MRYIARAALLSTCLLTGPLPAAAQGYYTGEPIWFSGVANFTRAMAVADLNLDGRLDLICANSGDPNTLYLNVDGELGTAAVWSTPTAGESRGVALGNILGDDTPEIVFANRSEKNQIFSTQNGNPTGWNLVWESDSLFDSRSVALGDIDRDGDLDLVFGNNDQQNTVYLNNAGSVSTSPDWYSQSASRTRRVVLGDVDGNGFIDLVCGNESDFNTLYLNFGGSLADTTAWMSEQARKTLGTALGDFDGDGDLDVAFGNQGNPDALYLNNGTVFADTALWVSSQATATHDIAFGDVDGDNDLDLVVANSNQPNMLFLNEGGLLDTIPAWSSTQLFNNAKAVALADIDGDGDLDLLTGSGGQPSGINNMYRNEQLKLAPQPSWQAAGADVTRRVLLVDVDDDFDADVVFVNSESPSTLYINNAGVLSAGPVWSAQTDSVSSGAVGDVSGDGLPDLVLVGPSVGIVAYLNIGGTFADTIAWTLPLAGDPAAVALGDVDNDGDVDLVCGKLSAPNTLHLNEGGVVADSAVWEGPPGMTTSVALWDLDRNSFLDLVCGNAGASASNTMYPNVGGTFSTFAIWTSGPANQTSAIALVDVDGDGVQDLVCANGATGPPEVAQVNTVYLGDRRSFSTIPDWSSGPAEVSHGVAAGDMDGDGDLDLLFANDGTHRLYLNQITSCGASFSIATDPHWSEPLGPSFDVALRDIDLDGDPDAVFANGAPLQPAVNTLIKGIKNPERPYGSSPVDQMPANDPYIRHVSVVPTGENRLEIRFQLFDIESNSAIVIPSIIAEGCPAELGPVPDLPASLIVTGSPDGDQHSFLWDYARVPFDPRAAVLVLTALPHTHDVAYTQRATSYNERIAVLVPMRPELELDPTLIDFPTVTVGDTVHVDLTIRNRGNLELIVYDIQLPFTEIDVSPLPPMTVDPSLQTVVRFSLRPSGEVMIPSATRIISNDLFTPELDLTTRTDVLGLNFSTSILNDQPEVPINEAITVVITPEDQVHVEGGSLFYRETGAAVFDETPLLPFDNQFVALIPAASVTEVGVDYYVSVFNSGIAVTDPFDAPNTFYRKDVATPSDAQLTVVTFPNSPNGYEANNDVVVTVDAPPGFAFVKGLIHLRRGGETTYQSVEFDDSGALPTASIPASQVTSRGIEYWIEVETQTRSLTSPGTDPATSPHPLPVTVLDLQEPTEHPGGRYRMVTVPLDFGGDDTKTLESILSDQSVFGPYDPFKWRSFRYVASETRYAEPGSAADALRFVLEPGRAFWLIAKGTNRVNTAPVDGLSTPTDVPFEIVIEPGWNQVGDPFNFPVAWDSVIVDTMSMSDAMGVVVEGPVAWDRGYVTDVGVMGPFEGYWVKNLLTAPVTLRVPPLEATVQPSLTSHNSADADAILALGIAAESRGVTNQGAHLEVRPNASNRWDRYDRASPPSPPGRTLSVYFPHS
jgi:hypothetical protein